MTLRIGIWFQENHTPYGGPAAVLSGTILGFYQWAETSGTPVVILLNESGDVNWSLNLMPHLKDKVPGIWHGPACFNRADAAADPAKSDTWLTATRALFPSTWFAEFISRGLPYTSIADNHSYAIWPSGVDTDYFTPTASAGIHEKTQDYFIYFKSQNYCDLRKVYEYFFNNWFGIKGTLISYYNHDHAMLREAARSSKFCIMLDGTETQGLAALEIMACDCPLFVLDATVCNEGGFKYEGATSVTNMDGTCGMKSRIEDLEKDFPHFLESLESYKPRTYVLSDYSYAAAARRLLSILTHGGRA